MGIHENEVIGQVRHAMALDPKLDAPKITIAMIGETLALSGVVDTREEVVQAEQIARKAAPGVPIDNGLTIGMTQQGVNGWEDRAVQVDAERAVASTVAGFGDRQAAVGVEVIRGLAHLQGTCATVKDRRDLIEAVRAVPGLKRVVADGLEVAPFGTADDIRLGNLAIERLQEQAPDLPAYVTVDVRERDAHLIGSVRSAADRSRAEDIVSQVPGIKGVHNELHLYQDARSSDRNVQIEQEVRQALGAAGLPMPNVHAYVTNGVLTLDGEVETPDQRHQAVMVANAVMKRMVGENYQVSDGLTITSRRGHPPHNEGELLQRNAHPGNKPVIPLEHAKGPSPADKAQHTASIEDRVPDFDQPLPKRKDRD